MFIKANPQDAQLLEKLINGAYRGAQAAQGWTSEAHLLDGQRTDVDLLSAQLCCAEIIFLRDSNDPPLSCVQLQKSETSCHISMLTVSPTTQGNGTGSKLLTAAENFAKNTWHCNQTTMNVIAQRPELIAFYQRRGYQLTGQSTPFPNDQKFGIPKVSNLVLLELKKVLT
jgi:ribosomal protein S18 acetylase RimI-like enzyme